ncbi:MAG TPA: Mov34/MPN/PAD-1 family protein [Ktedonobacteraceae bacterium]
MVTPETFVVRIPRTIYADMLIHITTAYPNEGCGALGCVGALVVENYPTANAAEHPDDFSIIGEADLVRIYNAIDEYDGEMIYYHSHPVSEAFPSARDKDWASGSGCLYLIFSHRFHPEEPYARIFSIQPDKTVIEGKIEVI